MYYLEIRYLTSTKNQYVQQLFILTFHCRTTTLSLLLFLGVQKTKRCLSDASKKVRKYNFRFFFYANTIVLQYLQLTFY